MKIYFRLEAPFDWVRVKDDNSGDQSRVDSFGSVNSLQDFDFEAGDELVGIISGEWVTTHSVELPAKTRKLFNAALPYALEESVSEEVDNMHFICPDWNAGEPCKVLAISKVKMRELQDLASDNDLPVTQLIPDHALMPLHEVAECSISLNENEIYAKTNNDYGVMLDKDFLDAWVMDIAVDQVIAVNDKELIEQLIEEHPNRDFRYWEFGNKVVHWLEYPVDVGFDLWGDQFRPSVSRTGGNPYLLPLFIIAFVVVGKVGLDLYQTISLKSEISAIKQEMRTSFSDALPDLGEVDYGQERSIMEQALKRLGRQKQSINLQSMLAGASKVLKSQNVTLSDISFQNEELTLTCRLSDFSQVDTLTKQLNGNARITAELQSSEADDGKIIASYLIKAKR